MNQDLVALDSEDVAKSFGQRLYTAVFTGGLASLLTSQPG